MKDGKYCMEVISLNIYEKFALLGVDNAPGQESLQKQKKLDIRGEKLPGAPVDFSHGDVDAHEPPPGSFELFAAGVDEGGTQAYTPYRGRAEILEYVASKLSEFTGAEVDAKGGLILTPGTQGALFLAMGANIMPGDKVAIVEPDYFANRKMVAFLGGVMVPIGMDYSSRSEGAGIDLDALERAFEEGVKLFLYSNPNNPTGCIYSRGEVAAIASLAKKHGVTVIADELYSRQIFGGRSFAHLAAQKDCPEKTVTIIGPSKTESLSGYRLGAGFGTKEIIGRMEKLQAIISLRCGGYNQAVFRSWFSEPEGWMEARVAEHERIRDELMAVIADTDGVSARPTEGGSYLFVTVPELDVPLHDFIRAARIQAGVIVTPGTEFGPQFVHSFRINFSQDRERAVAALRRFFTLMDRYRK
jgi:aspartate/methionine/tyrosine aminotransferase